MGSDNARVLALDVGTKRVGVAISDPLGLTAQPGPTLPRTPKEEFQNSLAELIRDEQVREVVVGLPLDQKGQRGKSARAVLDLVRELERFFPAVRWTVWDERFTTKSAEKALREAPKRKRERKGIRDQIAAQLILEAYLQYRAGGEK